MISILLIGREEDAPDPLEALDPSVEVLTAHGVEDALEKLGRNRRIDALLLCAGPDTEAMVEAIREDSPAHPPIFVPAGLALPIPDTLPLEASETREMLNLLKGKLESWSSPPSGIS